MFKERDKTSSHRHDLHRGHVHEVDTFGFGVADGDGILLHQVRVFALVADDDVAVHVALEAVVFVKFGRSRSDLEGVFFVCSEVADVVGNDLFHDVAHLHVVRSAVEIVEGKAVLAVRNVTVGILELEHLVHEAFEQFALAVVEVQADSVDFLLGEFKFHEEVRIMNEALEDAEMPLFFREVALVALSVLEFNETHNTVRGFDEAEVVHHGVRCEGVDKTDVRTFRSFNRAETAIVRVVNVTDFEACTFTGKTTRTESGETTLVSKFRKRVHLVHELGQLALAKECLDDSRDHASIHEFARSRLFFFGMERKVFADDARHTGEADGNLTGKEFAHGTCTTVAQVVDIVKSVAFVAVEEADHVFDDSEEVSLAHRHLGHRRHLEFVDAVEAFSNFLNLGKNSSGVNLCVQAVTTDFAKIVLVRVVEEEFVEVAFGGLEVRSFFLLLVGHGVDSLEGVFAGLRLVGSERVVDEEVVFFLGKHGDLFDTAFAEAFELLVVDDSVSFEDDFTRFFVNDIVEDDAVDEGADTFLVKVIECGIVENDFVSLLVEEVQDVLSRFEADAAKHSGSGDLLLAVDDEVKDVAFGVEFNPCAAVRNNTALVVGAAVGLHFFVKAHTRRTVQLRNDDAFGAVNDKRSVLGHDRKFANQDIVLDFFLELAFFSVLFEHLEGESCKKFHGIRETALTAFGDAVFRDAEIISFILQGIQILVIGDREDIAEHAFKPDVHPFFLRNVLLKELLVRSLLDFDQVREFQVELVGGIRLSLRRH